MQSWVQGIHHVTGAVRSAQRDHDFYTEVLGLRLIKRTVNHENPRYWHLFYGDRIGSPGSVITNFVFPEAPLPQYRRGRGSLTEVSYSVPPGSLEYWRERIASAGGAPEFRGERFGDPILGFHDPNGLPSELVECDDPRDAAASDAVPPERQIRGFYSVTALSRLPELTVDFFTRLLRFEVVDEDASRTRLAVGGGGPGRFVDVLDEPRAPWGVWGMGGLHHVAFTVESKEILQQLWQILGGAGLIVTDLRNRRWFHSMYLTEPGGINVEISDVSPGWTVDEPAEELGTRLCLPEQWEPRRAEIEAALEPLSF